MIRTNTVRVHGSDVARRLRILLTAGLIAWSAPAWGQWITPSRTASRPRVSNQDPRSYGRVVPAQGQMARPGAGRPQAWGQVAGPYGDADHRPPLTLRTTSFVAAPIVEPEPIEVNDLITVLIDVSARASSEGEIDRRKKADSQASLKDWVLLKGFTIFPDPQTLGDPTLGAEQNKKYRAEGGMETSESIKLSIQCRVVEFRDNGLLVLEGWRTYKINSETWETYYIGTFRPEDIMPDNSVESRHAFADELVKRESGSVRDGYRIGWLQGLMDRYQF